MIEHTHLVTVTANDETIKQFEVSTIADVVEGLPWLDVLPLSGRITVEPIER